MMKFNLAFNVETGGVTPSEGYLGEATNLY